MLDERVLAVLARLEEEDRSEREAGLPAEARSRQVPPTTGRFLFALAASQAGVEVLEIGGSRGYSSIWLAAGARVLGGRLISLEHDPQRCEAWRTNVAEAGLEEWAEIVEGDPDRLEQALQNLAANALRHTPDGGTITLSSSVEHGVVHVRVRDTGDGIPPEHLPLIFDRFYKADSARRAVGGSGLGLSIVKAIVERHHGSIAASNDNGAVFGG